MSSSSSDSYHRRHKKRKHRHHKHRSREHNMVDNINDALKSIREDMKGFSQRISNIENGQAATVQSTIVEVRKTHENIAEQSSQASAIAHPPPREEPQEVQCTANAGRESSVAGWGERDSDEPPDYNEHVFWEPEDDSDDQEPDTLKLSSTTTKIVEDAFGHTISNERRRSLKRKQPIPDTPFTKCPKLDPTIQPRLPKPAKDADRNLARLQTLVLDAAAPLLSTLEAARSGSLTPKGAAESAQLALKLLGNASANISTERRRKATTHLNPELGTLIEDEDNFREAAPFLFGKTFDQQAKDHIEAVKSLKKTTFTATRQPFPRGHPSSTRGGGTFRGRGTNKKFSAPQRGKRTQ